MEVGEKICETCAHYKECGTALMVHVMKLNIKCKAYKEMEKTIITPAESEEE